MTRMLVSHVRLVLAALTLTACGGAPTEGPAEPAKAASHADPANPLIGSWKVADNADCPYLGVTFSTGEMVVHFAATMASAAYDSAMNVYYEVKPGEVIVHDSDSAANAPAYEFETENQVRLGGTEGTCVFRRV